MAIHSIHCRGYRGVGRDWADDDCTCGATIKELRDELKRVRDGVEFWSYCMSEGMRTTCPERVTELMDFLISLKIAPYYVRNTHCEFVQAVREEEDKR